MPANSKGAACVDTSFEDAVAVTASDTIDEAHRLRGVRALWADVAGTVKIITEAAAARAELNGNPVPVTATQGVALTFLAGVPVPIRAAYVLATGTAATGIKALY